MQLNASQRATLVAEGFHLYSTYMDSSVHDPRPAIAWWQWKADKPQGLIYHIRLLRDASFECALIDDDKDITTRFLDQLTRLMG
jgi:hypothetical protein